MDDHRLIETGDAILDAILRRAQATTASDQLKNLAEAYSLVATQMRALTDEGD